MRIISKHLVPLAAPFVLAGAATAQRIEVTPFAGGFIPTGALGTVRVPGLQGGSVAVKAETVPAGLFGAKLSAYSKGRIGVEAMYFTSSPGMRIVVGGFNQTFDTKVDGGSLKAVYIATSEQSGTDLVLSAGMAGISHGGKGFAINGKNFDVGGTIGGGLWIAMSPNVTLRFDGDLLVYRFAAGPGLNATTQKDLVMSAGLALKLNH